MGALTRKGDCGGVRTAVPMHQGQKVTANPSERLKNVPPPAGSRYQNWKFQVENGWIIPGPELAGGEVKSRESRLVPFGSTVSGGLSRKIWPRLFALWLRTQSEHGLWGRMGERTPSGILTRPKASFSTMQ